MYAWTVRKSLNAKGIMLITAHTWRRMPPRSGCTVPGSTLIPLWRKGLRYVTSSPLSFIRDSLSTTFTVPIEKVRYRKRKVSTAPARKVYRNRLGRDFDSYLVYMKSHPNTRVVEMDTVIGKKDGTKKALLTLIFTDKGFMPVFLLPAATQTSVISVLDHLTRVLGIETFRTLFPVILTDNGSEFKDAHRIEFALNGERRTRVFYCDPQASWQKPHVERNHHLIRKILPKGTSFRLLTEEDAHVITCHINSFSKERFDNKTPMELMMNDPESKKMLDAMKYTLIPPDEVCLRPALLKKDR